MLRFIFKGLTWRKERLLAKWPVGEGEGRGGGEGEDC